MRARTAGDIAMNEKEIVEHLKKENCYSEFSPNCESCMFFEKNKRPPLRIGDDSCARNPDFKFNVMPTSLCNKFVKK